MLVSHLNVILRLVYQSTNLYIKPSAMLEHDNPYNMKI